MCHDRSVLGLPAADSADLRYPVFQFERCDSNIQVRPSLAEFMSILPYSDGWSVAIVIKTPAPELDGLTPLDWVRRGAEQQRLRTYAHILRAEFER